MDQILNQRQQIIEQMVAQQSQIKADREQIRILERRIERSEAVVQLQLDNVLELTQQYNQLAQQQPATEAEPEPVPAESEQKLELQKIATLTKTDEVVKIEC